MPERLQRRRTRGWRKAPGSVCVTRPGRWSNPFRPPTRRAPGNLAVLFEIEDGRVTALPYEGPLPAGRYSGFEVREVRDRADAVELFEAYITVIHDAYPDLIPEALGGRDLLCYCDPEDGLPCHGDALLRLANP